MDTIKVSVTRSAVISWPKPDTVQEIQPFLGFANFYSQFIKNFSPISAPLTTMLKRAPKNLHEHLWQKELLQI